MGHRSTEWCPRCGTSISAARAASGRLRGTRATRRSSCASRCSTASGESLVVWTTTPWTLPANVAAAVKPDAEYGLLRERRLGRRARASRTRRSSSGVTRRRSSSAGATRARSTTSPPGASVEHRVIPWDDVSLDEGTGIVHIAPGCGGEDFELSTRARPARAHAGRRGGPLLRRTTAGCTGSRPSRRPSRSSATWASAACSSRRGGRRTATRICWRCHTPLDLPHRPTTGSSRSTSSGQPLLDANADGRVDARLHGQAHGRLAAQHGRLEHLAPPLLRPAAAVLPVRVRAPERDRLARRARGARARRARAARGAAPAVDRRRADPLRGVRRGRSSGSTEVGDVWLDAGIVPFSTLGWQNPECVPEGYATGAAKGLTTRRPARPRVLGAVVPGRLGLGDARADPALVLLAALHVGRADRPRAVQARARLREDARRARPRDARLVGQHDRRRATRSRAWAPT